MSYINYSKIIEFYVGKQINRYIDVYEQLINSDPTQINNYWYLGAAYVLDNKIEMAQSIWMSILWESDNLDNDTQELINILQNIALDLFKINYYQEAKLFFEQLISLEEKTLTNYKYLLEINLQLDNITEAEFIFKYLIDIDRENSNIYLEYAQFLAKQYRQEELFLILKQGIKKFPSEQNLYLAMVQFLKNNGRAKEAIAFAEQGLKLNPDNIIFQLENAKILPIIYESEEEIEFYRKRFTDHLDNISQNLCLKNEMEKKNALTAISLSTNFYLQYQGINILDLQTKYALIVSKIIGANYPEFITYPSIKKDKKIKKNKIKIGYISSKMSDNVIGHLFQSWVTKISKKEFEIHCYYIGEKKDLITKLYRENSNKFVEISGNFQLLCKTILDDKLDILVYLDLGMSAKLTKMAELRFAPIQCKGWGPPVTSGSHKIDYFLSSDLMEPKDGKKHYSETLIKLPNLAFSYSQPQFPRIIKNRNDFGLPRDAVIYWSSQSLFKYLPQYDYIFPEIATKVVNSKFIFIEFPLSDYVNNLFKKRLQKAFMHKTLDWEKHCIFSPGLSYEDFLNMMLISDVALDTFTWSGGKTTLEALSCNLPVVTCPGEFLRGRHSYGILKMLGVTETIASSEKEYINIAVKLGNDKAWREKIRLNIKANQNNLYDDLECIRGLEVFYRNVVVNKI